MELLHFSCKLLQFLAGLDDLQQGAVLPKHPLPAPPQPHNYYQYHPHSYIHGDPYDSMHYVGSAALTLLWCLKVNRLEAFCNVYNLVNYSDLYEEPMVTISSAVI